MELSDLRRDFNKFNLDVKRMLNNPAEQLNAWLKQAEEANIGEFNAMVISTVSQSGKPSSRVVLLKEITDSGELIFFTNYKSRKGEEIKSNPFVALNFFWKELERQVRIEGKVSRTSSKISEEYFNSRPIENRVSAIVSPQSQEIENIDVLRRKSDEAMANNEIKIPDYWGGYKIKPDYFEFWQGGKNRLHHRIIYRAKGVSWLKARLGP